MVHFVNTDNKFVQVIIGLIAIGFLIVANGFVAEDDTLQGDRYEIRSTKNF